MKPNWNRYVYKVSIICAKLLTTYFKTLVKFLNRSITEMLWKQTSDYKQKNEVSYFSAKSKHMLKAEHMDKKKKNESHGGFNNRPKRPLVNILYLQV